MRFHRHLGLTASFGALVGGGLLLAACEDTSSFSQRSLAPIPRETVALMEQVGSSKDAPMLIRAYKKEAELELWKMRSDGRYVHLKTYPMCRWSGQLGPKSREGDRQVPEGFYSIGPNQMNPNSNYYLSFNIGYPNAYDRAWGHTGGTIMVHGACSSAGCFSMTDKQIAEIYAIARQSLGAGQRSIQMQSYPFRMTAENLAKHRLDPNIGFWKQLKQGSDHFETTQQEPVVGVCGKRYVFDAVSANGQSLDPSAPCPLLKEDEEIKARVAEKAARDDAKIAELVAKGVAPVRLVYQDGGQHPDFNARVSEVSRPEALAAAPVEVALEDKANKTSAKAGAKLVARSPVVTMAAAKAATRSTTVAAAPQSIAASAPVEPAPERSKITALALQSRDAISGWLGMHPEKPAPQPTASDAPSPPASISNADSAQRRKTAKAQKDKAESSSH
jgi:murein L,D-transpeptidase YafK